MLIITQDNRIPVSHFQKVMILRIYGTTLHRISNSVGGSKKLGQLMSNSSTSSSPPWLNKLPWHVLPWSSLLYLILRSVNIHLICFALMRH